MKFPRKQRVGLFLFFCFLSVCFIPQPKAEEVYHADSGEVQNSVLKRQVVDAALEGLKSVVDLWRGHDFSALYELGTMESQRLFSKDRFINLMKNSSRQLQCCWTTVQDLQGIFRSPTQVYVETKLGYENFHNTHFDPRDQDGSPSQWVISSSFDPRAFVMVLQQGLWRIDLAEILLASGYLPESLRMGSPERP